MPKDGDSTTSQGTLCQGSVTPTVRKCFLMFKRNLLCLSLCPLPLVLSLGTAEKSLAPSSLHLGDLQHPCGQGHDPGWTHFELEVGRETSPEALPNLHSPVIFMVKPKDCTLRVPPQRPMRGPSYRSPNSCSTE